MAILSVTAEYALRAVLQLAAEPGQGLVPVDELARALNIPRNYLSKILSTLARQRVLESTRGKRGGFRLARRPARIMVDDVINPFVEVSRPHCLLGNGICNDRSPCAAHAAWRDVAESMRQFFRKTSIADMLDQHERFTRPERTVAR